MRTSLAALAVLALAFALPSLAQEQVLSLDPGRSQITFTLDATFHTVEGRVALKEGKIDFDQAAGSADGRIVFESGRVTTGKPDRDETMHREVLQSGNFPEITFEPSAMEFTPKGSDGGTVKLIGKMNIRGLVKPLEIVATVIRTGQEIVVDGTFEIPYVAWGIEDPSVFILRVAKVIVVRIHAFGTLSTPPA